MSYLRTFLVVVSAIMVGGCSTTGGTIGGLFPAPKFLKGEIKNGIYTAQDKSFSVVVPHKEGSYEYTYMQIKEQYAEYGAYISFGPAAFDQSIYRIEITKRVTAESQNVKFEATAPKVVEVYKAQLEKGYGAALQATESRQELINGRKTYYSRLTQQIPAGTNSNNKAVNLTHEVYIIDFEKSAAVLWVQTPDTTTKAAIEAHAFAESVIMY